MAVMRIDEIREMTPNEREDLMTEMRDELLTEKASAAAGGMPENPGRIKELRRTIAKIKTVEKEEAA